MICGFEPTPESYTPNLKSLLSIPTFPLKPCKPESFRQSILNLIRFGEQNIGIKVSLNYICETFHFQKRRLYDVINVFDIVGICVKLNLETIEWCGLKNVIHKFESLRKRYNICENQIPQDTIISDDCISITQLTLSFIKCILSLKVPCFDIRQIGMFLSRSNNRFKTTLCKLYQISHILESAGIIEKTPLPGELMLSKHFLARPKVEILSVTELLNHRDAPKCIFQPISTLIPQLA
ncbi:hypothetical protein TVAG_000100 [Trichomonas vaginalis G3]|uniref:E2F/DP family winged-helix DNA-binding domain-containing protein n=1 Tax=Trichomonas vaginalis (strain ATCC PRA-98 / G3) TaxID=412133 RepID=A2FFX1_TRIV3|nr:transcription factor, enhancer of yellow 2 family [Trichomonas vaginalis G3]EAX96181.1 hypothetical protein TVAG_000100 [Trichomonas vaginalis G3]KAI5506309.1 transcription factor, enhancer of yellow 2 family [Trichomonas vaginalis G3]|eukprot:XP_001309111.1 hypothetical protein [Trichomonas vaginalis G3]